MSWTAVVPIKPAGARKSRLAGMSAAQRAELTDRMLAHVLSALRAHPAIGSVLVLGAEPVRGFDWIADEGRGLNAELEAARARLPGDMLVVHADLPVLGVEDVTALLAMAERTGAAIAPDRHGTGTNALALKANAPFTFRFGADSRRLHAAQLPDGAAVVERPGLALDIDTPEDLRLAGPGISHGR